MKKRKNSQRGAVSVLVVITMLMLIVFGLLALTSALAFERLGRKAVLWAGEYYELDSMATEHVQIIDECLFHGEKAARDYIAGGNHLKTTATGLDSAAQGEILRRFGTSYGNAEKERMLGKIFSRLYFFHAVQELNKLAQTNAFFTVAPKAPFASAPDFLTNWSRDPEAGDVLIEFAAMEEGEIDGLKNISITLTIEPPVVNFAFSGDAASGGRDPQSLNRYRILEWREWQEELTMQDTPFWDGTFENLPELPKSMGELEFDDSLPED